MKKILQEYVKIRKEAVGLLSLSSILHRLYFFTFFVVAIGLCSFDILHSFLLQ